MRVSSLFSQLGPDEAQGDAINLSSNDLERPWPKMDLDPWGAVCGISILMIKWPRI